MNWTTLGFGKHRGLTLPQVMFKDPDWFFWASEDKAFKGFLLYEAKEIYKKATRIRVPQNGKEPRLAEYAIQRSTGRFLTMVLRAQSELPSPNTLRLDVIDMIVPRQFSGCDKQGYIELLQNIKHYLFGDSSYHMTKRSCEAFFDDDSNFA